MHTFWIRSVALALLISFSSHILILNTNAFANETACNVNLHSDEELSFYIQERVEEEIHNADQWLKQKTYQVFRKKIERNTYKFCKANDICSTQEVAKVIQQSLAEVTPEFIAKMPVGADKFIKSAIGNTYIAGSAIAALMAGYKISNIEGIPKYIPYMLTPVIWTLFISITAPFQDFLSSKFRMIGYRIQAGKSIVRKGEQLKKFNQMYADLQTKFTTNQTTARNSMNAVVSNIRTLLKDTFDIISNNLNNPQGLQRGADRFAEFIVYMQKNFPEVSYDNENILTAVRLIFTKHIDISERQKLKPLIIKSIQEIETGISESHLAHYEKIILKWFDL